MVSLRDTPAQLNPQTVIFRGEFWECDVQRDLLGENQRAVQSPFRGLVGTGAVLY
jgi:hypothetical protein